MTPPRSASRPNGPAEAKLAFITAARAASPLRAVEKYPWTAVSAAAAAAMAATVIAGGSFFGTVGGGIFNHGLGIASSLLKSRLAGPVAQGVASVIKGNDGNKPAAVG